MRLAVCDLALPAADPAPLVLDDALADFDDGRMALALETLEEYARGRQVLLFTCHGREAAWREGRGRGGNTADHGRLPLHSGAGCRIMYSNYECVPRGVDTHV